MSDFQIVIDGSPVDDAFYDALSSLQVEENADLPDAIRLTLPVDIKDDDLTWVGDQRLRPYANIAVVVTPAEGAPPQCVFDGYVLSHKVHLQSGITASTLEVWGQDASVLMGLEEKVREWSGLTDGAVANQVFDEYGFTPAPGNTEDDSPAHTEDAHTLMQRGSDLDFLRRLARRTGRWCRVAGGSAAGERVGYFAVPDLTGTPVVTLNLNDPDKSQVAALDFHWDVARPTTVGARQASLTDTDQAGEAGDSAASGLAPLDARDLATFAGRDTHVVLTAAADGPELPGRSRAVLREASWFARCEGSADISMVKQALRVGSVVAIEGVGTLLSGNQLVKSVRHTITANSHAMQFTLVRNALGGGAVTNEELLMELADRVRSRYYGKYRGTVTDNDDPSGMLRIRATVPAVLGEVPSGWALPCVPYAGADVGVFFLPDVGAAVWIEFEGGDVSYPIWSGCFWRSGELPSDASPTTRGVVTKAASKLLFDDDGETVTLEDANDNTVLLDSSGVTSTRGTQKVTVGDASVSINDGAMEVM